MKRLIERIEDIYETYSNTEFKSVYIDLDGKEYEADLMLYIATDNEINESWVDNYEIEGVWNAYGNEVEMTANLEIAIQTKIEELDYTPNYKPKYEESDLNDLNLD